MTYLHTSPTDPTAPMWMFHLPTFTLAQLHLGAGPGGRHVLTVDAATPPPDEALLAFAATLDAMAPSASDHISQLTREGLAKDLPEFMHFAPAEALNHTLTLSPRHDYAHIRHSDVPDRLDFYGGVLNALSICEAACAFDSQTQFSQAT